MEVTHHLIKLLSVNHKADIHKGCSLRDHIHICPLQRCKGLLEHAVQADDVGPAAVGGDVGNVVLRDRQRLAEDGILIVVIGLDSYNNEIVAGPEIVSRGFVYVKESDELLDEARQILVDSLESCMYKKITDWGRIKTVVKDVAGDFLWKKTKRRPMILPIIIEV